MRENELGEEFAQSKLRPTSGGNDALTNFAKSSISSAQGNMSSASNLGSMGRTFPFQATATTQVMIAANDRRVGFALQNNGAESIWFSYGKSIQVNGTDILGGIKIDPSGYYELIGTYCPQNEITVRCITGPCIMTVVEVTK